MPAAPVLAIEDLHVWFGTGSTETHTLKGISLAVAPGERVGLVGESGCGKTTTILAAMGLLPPSASVAGRILLGGEDLLARGERSVAAHRWTDLAMVFQGAMNAFNPVHTVGWQIAEALRIHRPAPREAITRRVHELLELVGIPAGRADAYPHEFSGGMRQRAVIAMALACEPKVLLADEPTTALDVVIQDQILALLTRLCDELALALILVTHDLGVVAQTCDRAAVMLDGEIVEHGPVLDLHRNPTHSYTKRLFEATPSLGDARPAAPAAAAPSALLEVDGLRVSYSGRRGMTDALLRRPGPEQVAVDGISLTVNRGELVALVGQSGCGKTSTVQAVLGMVPAAGGDIRLDGESTRDLDRSGLRQLRRRVQMIYQDPYESLDGRFRVRDTLEEPLRIHRAAAGREQRRAIVRGALERVGLTPAGRYLDRYPHELSGGQRQRVSIAACLVLQPELLLADEPVSMLDVSLRAGILDLLDELRTDSSLGILMITHDLSTAATYADRILVMHEGRIVEHGPAWQVVNEPVDGYTKMLLAAVPSPDPQVRPQRLALTGDVAERSQA
ncbi:ABC transporter ATP-binding protein [Jatrophihabitans cynanchi]|jgi:peptide/nickel transport system ATP-binding protein|uniref:ABC transporter ATP-binding protein n=1 Tax=Jatrophihabitans cynanchi TaxID=2944128 RepID=A0ABY7JVV0_9ACTN|nr:ABC transporter ATP-binding protein [Jatrophihabitans sp. SB3-54]WAX56682.1 ABC transporter ATP-binding protein [Jatrophihabitans sp. SB3-54]